MSNYTFEDNSYEIPNFPHSNSSSNKRPRMDHLVGIGNQNPLQTSYEQSMWQNSNNPHLASGANIHNYYPNVNLPSNPHFNPIDPSLQHYSSLGPNEYSSLYNHHQNSMANSSSSSSLNPNSLNSNSSDDLPNPTPYVDSMYSSFNNHDYYSDLSQSSFISRHHPSPLTLQQSSSSSSNSSNPNPSSSSASSSSSSSSHGPPFSSSEGFDPSHTSLGSSSASIPSPQGDANYVTSVSKIKPEPNNPGAYTDSFYSRGLGLGGQGGSNPRKRKSSEASKAGSSNSGSNNGSNSTNNNNSINPAALSVVQTFGGFSGPQFQPNATPDNFAQNQQQQQQLKQIEAKIKEYTDNISNLEMKLENLRYLQSQMLAGLPGHLEQLCGVWYNNNLLSFYAMIQNSIRDMERIWDSVFLNKTEMIFRLANTKDQYVVFLRQVSLFIEEVKFIQKTGGHQIKPFVTLVIVKQPFPVAIKQGIRHCVDDNAVELRLLTSAHGIIAHKGTAQGTATVECVGPIRSELNSFNPVQSSKRRKAKGKSSSPTGKKEEKNKDGEGKSTNSEEYVQGGEEHLREDGRAVFEGLTFPVGSKVKPTSLKFSARIRLVVQTIGNNGAPTQHHIVEEVVTEKSKDFVVMTNHHQRPEAEGKLLKVELFGETPSNPTKPENGLKNNSNSAGGNNSAGNNTNNNGANGTNGSGGINGNNGNGNNSQEVTWERFCNALQMHYIRETQQTEEDPERCLLKSEFDWLRKTLFGKRHANVKPGMQVGVSIAEFEKFWEWFGVVLYHVRNKQKNYLNMWLKGIIIGFLGREEAEWILKGEGIEGGTFLLRWSERKAGKLVIVFKDSEDDGIKHYLIKDEDVDINARTNLADFLKKCDNLHTVCMVEKVGKWEDGGKVVLRDKDEMLEKHYTHRAKKDYVFGYVERV
eukprot:TRINITY_DN1573_c0_g1_i1.p1 TRINITY_DN1573_c0_g1~~TRINITY_DN1573_c0_g1_i1.p1  ORF type:complete len:919 (-),score=241.28 TRINITY_DN1573_c0_g1_i1:136-2892(-)